MDSRDDRDEKLTAAKRQRPWADTWWEDGTEEFDRALLLGMTSTEARTIANACKSQAPATIADWCHETYGQVWRVSWLPGAQMQVGAHICQVARQFFDEEVPSDVESIRDSLGRAMTRWISVAYLNALALLGVGLVAVVAFSSPIGGAAMFGGFLLIILIYDIVGHRVFGSLIPLFSWTRSVRFQRLFFSYGIRVAWRNACHRHGSHAAP